MIIDAHCHIGLEKDYVEGNAKQQELTKWIFGPFEKPYNYSVERAMLETIEQRVEKMNGLGIGKTILIGIDATTSHGYKVEMEYIAAVVKRYPDRFIGTTGIDPLKGVVKAVDDMRRAAGLGLSGMKLFPAFGYDPTDDRYDPIFEEALRLGWFVVIHVGSQIIPRSRLRYCSPLLLDDIAYKFPDLRMIETHLGWPWIGDALIVARKNANVYVDFSGLIPEIHIGEMDHTANVGTYKLAEIQLSDKILFGSDHPHGSMDRIIDMVRKLPVGEAFKQKMLGENAARFLRLT